jgi:cation diffusion facilitator family transporter
MSLQRIRDESLDPKRQRLYRRAILIGLAGNGLLAAAKGTAAWFSGSSAVLSDAANSLSDVLYSLLMAIGLYLAQQPADEGHPQGHSRFEPVVSLLIAGAMGVAGIAAAREAVGRFLSGASAVQAGWPTAVLLVSALIKVLMSLLAGRIGRLAQSPAILASARDSLSDVLTSGAALLGVWGSSLVHPLLDPLAGMLVALWILRSLWGILSENLGYLTGRGAQPELTAQIVEIASGVPGVLGVHQVIADHVGPQLRVDIHVDVDGRIGLIQAHTIADQVEAQIAALPSVDLVFVHVEPSSGSAGEEAHRSISVALRHLAGAMGLDVHHIWVYEAREHHYAEVHVETDSALSLSEAHELVSSYEGRAESEIPGLVEITAHIEPQAQPTQVRAPGMDEAGVAEVVQNVAAEIVDEKACHQINVRRSDGGWSVSLHCSLPGDLPLVTAHGISTQLEMRLREEIEGLNRVIIHTEPGEESS